VAEAPEVVAEAPEAPVEDEAEVGAESEPTPIESSDEPEPES
jgi:hypothetical protein